MNIILLGAPGSGKDTLADQLADEYNYTVLTPGKIFREEADKGTDLGIWARDKYWGRGQLVPDDTTNDLINTAYHNLFPIKDARIKKNIIFNGYPRTASQAEWIWDTIGVDLILCLNVDEDVAVERLMGRGRPDDTDEIMRERFKIFNKNNHEIKDFFHNESEETPVVDIDANSTIKRVFELSFNNIINFTHD